MPVSGDGRPSNPGVRFPPPLIFLAPYAVTWWLNDRIEFLIVGGGPPPWLEQLGAAVMLAGFALMAWGLITFARLGTSALPFHAARTLVIRPPYTFTRNPMYLGLLAAYLGGAFVTNWAWPLVFLPAVIAVIQGFVIAREERYLSAEFDADYAAYCRRVRRWI